MNSEASLVGKHLAQRSTTLTRRLWVKVVLLACVLFAAQAVCSMVCPQSAYGLATTSVTADDNEDVGDRILGGVETRLTWTGKVNAGETVVQMNIDFPAGCVLAEDAYITLQESLKVRNEERGSFDININHNVAYTHVLTDSQLQITFEEGIAADWELTIEIFGFIFPNGDASYQIVGSYIDDKGVSHELAAAKTPIAIVQNTSMQNNLSGLEEQTWVQWWNSDKFRNAFLNPVRALAAIPQLFGGWLLSLSLVALGFPLAIPVGLGISFLRMSRFWLLRFISSIYVNVIRGTPLFLQIYISFFGLPMFIADINYFVVGFLVLALNSSAYLAEIFRAGIQSINKGQFEASSSLGMSAAQTMFSVIIPQTIRRVIPTMTSEFILLFKDTSLLAAVGVMDMMMFAKIQANVTGNMTPYVVAAGFYLLVTLPLTRVISVFEKKLAATDGRTTAPEEKKPKKRVGLFSTTAPLSATASDPAKSISPEQHDSQ